MYCCIRHQSHIILTLNCFDFFHNCCDLSHIDNKCRMIRLSVPIEGIVVGDEGLQELLEETLHQTCTLEVLLAFHPERIHSEVQLRYNMWIKNLLFHDRLTSWLMFSMSLWLSVELRDYTALRVLVSSCLLIQMVLFFGLPANPTPTQFHP